MDKAMSQNEIEKMAAFIGGSLFATFSSMKLWIAEITFLNITLEVLVKGGITIAVSFVGGLAGMASKDFYRQVISPRLKKLITRINNKKPNSKPKKL